MSRKDNILFNSIEYLKGVGPVRADLLKKELGIHVFKDLLYYFPFRYVDRTSFYKIKDITVDGMTVQSKVTIVDKELIKGKNNRNRLEVLAKDETGFINLLWFQGVKWMDSFIEIGKEYIIYGKIGFSFGKKSIVHPEIDISSEENLAKNSVLSPVYSSTEKLNSKGLNSRNISKLVFNLLEKLKSEPIAEILPSYILEKYQLEPLKEAFFNIHFPKNEKQLANASKRLKFDELFFMQFRLLYSRNIRKDKIKGHTFEKVGDYFNKFYKKNLPFELTGAQKRVIKEIRKDLGSGVQMNRLLQGDVGSGKTIVALMTKLIAIDNGFQTCIMAPTEILAQQHYNSIENMVKGLGLNIAFLSGSVKGKKRNSILNALESGEIHILVGTHALIEPWVKFQNLGLVIIDEQHRFGVKQRAKLWTKGNIYPPHILVMTATPIPRTLSMTVFGDLDVSKIDELPPGRKAIKTFHLYENKRPGLIKFLKEQIGMGRQIYVVYPLIEESEKLDLQNLQEGYERMLEQFPRPEYQMSIVHGKMKPADKDFEMQRFKDGKTQILVGTTVIEVGVDVPNATVMVIENANRFGLSQLHQLRGRVGRGAQDSYCFLMTDYKVSKEAKKKLNIMVMTNDGFEIANEDLKIRGPGDIEGLRQSGLLDLRLANLTQDENILVAARMICKNVLEEDPKLESDKNIRLKKYILENKHLFRSWGRIS
ncbi:MAG TPA: ATP-dependent DNA helicase RecG [Bacteroidetes bacterium]|nr:ATP-dependent DNA helicase RecG [Bacteroidota bacterium]